jgi:hypothetical protein
MEGGIKKNATQKIIIDYKKKIAIKRMGTKFDKTKN